MKIVQNNLIPFKGFTAINLFGIIFVRKGKAYPNLTGWSKLIRHESIHTAQMKELLYIGFYIIYFFEWLYRLITTRHAYRSISFEKEAYEHQDEPEYLDNRKHFAQWR